MTRRIKIKKLKFLLRDDGGPELWVNNVLVFDIINIKCELYYCRFIGNNKDNFESSNIDNYYDEKEGWHYVIIDGVDII